MAKSTLKKIVPPKTKTITAVNRSELIPQDIYRIVDDPNQGKQKIELAYQDGLTENESTLDFQSRIHAASGSACQHVGLHLLTKVLEAIAPSYRR